EIAHLRAILAKHENAMAPDQIVQLFDTAAEQHFKNLRGLPLGKKYLLCLNPDFILEIVREYMNNISLKPVESGQSLNPSLRKSAGILEQLTKAVPGLLEGLFLLAKVKYLSGDTAEAKSVLRRIIDQEATYSEAYILLAQVYTREGNTQLAYESLENGLSYNFDLKTHPIYHLIRARIFKKEQKYEEACKLLQSALNLPGVKKRHQPETLKTPRSKSEQMISSVPITMQDRVSVFLELAEIQILLNRVHEASILLQEASTEFQGTSEESRILLTNVDLALKRGDINQAIEILIQIKPDQTYYLQSREKLAEIYLKHRRDKKLFIKTYKELVDRNPTPQALVILGDAYMSIMEVQMMLSKAYLNSEQYELCEQSCTYMSKTFPNDISVQIMMANYLLRKNEIEKAIQQYKDIIQRNPNNFDPFVQMTKSLYRAGRLDEISDILEKTEQNNLRSHNDAAFNFAKGLLTYYLCKPNEAVFCFNKCRRDKQYGRQAIYTMVKIVLNPDNEIISNEDDWKRKLQGPRSEEAKVHQATAFNLLQGMSEASNDIQYRVLENRCLGHTGEKHTLDQATENLAQILNDHKDNVGALCAISECLMGLKNAQKARQYLKKTTKIAWNIDDADEIEQCWLMLAMTYVQATKYDEALDLCKKVLNVNKCSTRALEILGMMNEQTGAHKDAADNYEQAW
ncbi:unnamed protein product, partial [Rotaria socialis]